MASDFCRESRIFLILLIFPEQSETSSALRTDWTYKGILIYARTCAPRSRAKSFDKSNHSIVIVKSCSSSSSSSPQVRTRESTLRRERAKVDRKKRSVRNEKRKEGRIFKFRGPSLCQGTPKKTSMRSDLSSGPYYSTLYLQRIDVVCRLFSLFLSLFFIDSIEIVLIPFQAVQESDFNNKPSRLKDIDVTILF